MEKFLIGQILKIVSDIDLYIDNLQQMSGTRRITEYLNIEHDMGKYHAFIECLEEINLDEFVRIHNLTNQKVNNALKKLEEIYQYMMQ
jgi:ribosomal protein L12E/L44/L45/RPP1/RPP2